MPYATKAALDLTLAPLNRDRAHWTHLTDYGACQALAETARAAGIDVLRYESARDPAGGVNIALFACGAFAARAPRTRQTWRLYLSGSGARAVCGASARQIEFDRGAFASDPRIAAFEWQR